MNRSQVGGIKLKFFNAKAFFRKPSKTNLAVVNRWINALPQGSKCCDFTLSVTETELTDGQLKSWDYRGKLTQFYVPRPQ